MKPIAEWKLRKKHTREEWDKLYKKQTGNRFDRVAQILKKGRKK